MPCETCHQLRACFQSLSFSCHAIQSRVPQAAGHKHHAHPRHTFASAVLCLMCPVGAAAGIALSGWREAAIAYRVTTPFFKKFTQDAPLFFIGGGLFFIVEFVSIEIE
jgi:hypothetical protein